MTAAEFTALLTLMTVTSFTPGPNTTLSTALAANLGLRGALRFVLAVPLGWSLILLLCAGGVGAVVLAWPALRLAIELPGVAYLLYLAFKLVRVPGPSQAPAAAAQVGFAQGVLLQFLNIKVWFLVLTVVAGWLAGRSDALGRLAVVLPTLLLFGFASNFCYALLGSAARGWLAAPAQSGARLRWFNRCMAALLLATAVWMLGGVLRWSLA